MQVVPWLRPTIFPQNCCLLCVVLALQDTVRSLKERACAAFGLEPDKVEIWDYFNHGKYACIEKDLDKDLETARILDEQPILLDDKVCARPSSYSR